ncbi:MAG: glutamyl-tRNA reductase [Spirochaetes bacterium]|nr:glutamyl-tRNA reductase [Spirochaetota bacterium]
MELLVVGLNHTTAPVAVREKLSFSSSETTALLKELLKQPIVREALLLSTCNRTELYACINGDIGRGEEFIRDFLVHFKGGSFPLQKDYFYTFHKTEAVRHLFKVAAGLDSMIVGENQILGQVKTAFNLCCDAGANGIILNRLFHWAFKVGKRARSETEIGMGSISVSSTAIELAKEIFKDLSMRSVLLIGAGETGELTALCLKERGIRDFYISNRTFSRAENLASLLQAKAVAFAGIDETLVNVDIVISSTSSREYIVTADFMKKIMIRRNNRPLFIIDISVPRNFDPEINRLDNIFVYSIDDLQNVIDKNIEKRNAEIEKVQDIMKEEVNNFLQWKNTLKVTTIIRELQKRVENIRMKELKNNRKQFKKEDWENLDLLTKSMMKKIIRMPLLKIKEYNEDSRFGTIRLDTVRDIFQLEDDMDYED